MPVTNEILEAAILAILNQHGEMNTGDLRQHLYGKRIGKCRNVCFGLVDRGLVTATLINHGRRGNRAFQPKYIWAVA